jgi:hypothetical protein
MPKCEVCNKHLALYVSGKAPNETSCCLLCELALRESAGQEAMTIAYEIALRLHPKHHKANNVEISELTASLIPQVTKASLTDFSVRRFVK